VRPTRVRLLLLIAVVAAALSWGALRAWQTSTGSLPVISWVTPTAIALLALALLVTAVVLRPRLRRRPGTLPVAPLFAARLAALALASSRVGAAVVGVYAGFALVLADQLDVAFGRRRFLPAVLTAVAGLALVGAALLLENSCRIRVDGDDDAGTDGGLGRAGSGSDAAEAG
jgi:O-antigen ligase